MPRFVYLLAIGIALIALAFAVTDWLLGPRQGVTEANCRRIRAGMTMAEVEAILGGSGQWFESEAHGPKHWDYYQWAGTDGQAFVFFFVRGPIRGERSDDAGKVCGVLFARSPCPSPLSRLRVLISF